MVGGTTCVQLFCGAVACAIFLVDLVNGMGQFDDFFIVVCDVVHGNRFQILFGKFCMAILTKFDIVGILGTAITTEFLALHFQSQHVHHVSQIQLWAGSGGDSGGGEGSGGGWCSFCVAGRCGGSGGCGGRGRGDGDQCTKPRYFCRHIVNLLVQFEILGAQCIMGSVECGGTSEHC